MKLWSDSFSEGSRLREDYAFIKPHPTKHAELAKNRNPHLAWGELPDGVKSLVLIMHDADAPMSRDMVNKPDKTVPFDFPRTEFYNWVLVDIDPKNTPIQAGEFSKEVTAKGKPGPQGPNKTRQGLNDYTNWFMGNPNMAGNYFGYDGPGPAWNDERIHHYAVTLYALKEKRCPVEGNFTGKDVVNAMVGLIMAKVQMNCTYALYPKAR
jgi:Raf kinase inhibitor-like YbhB/YbcL family protein